MPPSTLDAPNDTTTRLSQDMEATKLQQLQLERTGALDSLPDPDEDKTDEERRTIVSERHMWC